MSTELLALAEMLRGRAANGAVAEIRLSVAESWRIISALERAVAAEGEKAEAVPEHFREAANIIVSAGFVNAEGYARWMRDWADDVEAGRNVRARMTS